MITQFSIENFKSYKKAVLPLAPLTLLIGANASGKSNALEAVRLLVDLAKGIILDESFGSLKRQQQLTVRGKLTDLYFNPRQPAFTLGCSLDSADWQDLVITLVNDKEEHLFIDHEYIAQRDGQDHLYDAKDEYGIALASLAVTYKHFKSGRRPTIEADNWGAIFSQFANRLPIDPKHPQARQIIKEVTRQFQTTLSNVFFLDPQPGRMRDYVARSEKKLAEDGANLSAVLYNLCKSSKNRKALLNFVRFLPEQDLQELKFIETSRGDVMLQVVEQLAGAPHVSDAPIISDGTLRVLAVSAALLSAPEGATLVVEEIDNGIHPSRAQQLLENISQVARQRHLQVLLTSHNPALLDALPLEAVPDVVCCYRDPKQGDSRLMRLQDLADYPELIAQGSLGRLMTTGVLERFLKRTRTPEEKKQAALQWLAEYQKTLEDAPEGEA